MKLNKITAALAVSAVAASALTVSASANMKLVEGGHAALTSGTQMFLCQIYNNDGTEANKPKTDYGINGGDIAKLSVIISPVDHDEWFTGATGGGLVLSINGGDIASGTDLWDKYNWQSQSYWGVNDEDIDVVTQNPDDVLVSEKIGDYTYKITSNVYNNPFNDDGVKEVNCIQVAFQEWGSDITEIEVLQLDVLDANDNVLISFDKLGNPTVTGGAAAPAEAAPAPAPAETTAPAADSAVDAAAAPAAGDTSAPSTTPSKGSPDTGVEDVAVFAGLAIVAGGIALVAKKRK